MLKLYKEFSPAAIMPSLRAPTTVRPKIPSSSETVHPVGTYPLSLYPSAEINWLTTLQLPIHASHFIPDP